MSGTDLTIFDFDYDLTWAAFFMNANQKIYGRYGGRDEGPAEKGLSLSGLKYAMQSALDGHRKDPLGEPAPVKTPFRTVEQFPAARDNKNCIHCHRVYDFRRDYLIRKGQWSTDEIWVYPPPENIGVTLDVDQGDRIEQVVGGSPAARAGLRAGDIIETLHGISIASYGDVQYALHRSPKAGKVQVAWHRDGQRMSAELQLAEGWRVSDISWRESMWGLEPAPRVFGKDLTATEKAALGLSSKRLAFRQGRFVPSESRKAGIRPNDVILGIDGRELEMTVRQFNAWVRLNHDVGDRVTFDIIRDGRRTKVKMMLTSRTH